MKYKLLYILIFVLTYNYSFCQYQFTNYTTYNTGSNSLGSNTILLIDENPVTNEIYFSCLDGLMKYDNNNFSAVESPLLAEWDNPIKFDIDYYGNIWFSYYDSIYKYDGINTYSYSTPSYLGTIYDFLADNQGNIWIARSAGLYRFDGTTWTEYNTSNGLLNDFIDCLFEDSNGFIWAGSSVGVNKFDGTNWTSYSSSSGIQWQNGSSNVFSISEDLAGKIWVGGNEIASLSGNTWTVLDPTVLLGSSQTINNINSIACDNTGVLWFGTDDNGVFFKDGIIWDAYTETDGLGDNHVLSIYVDSQDRVWIGQNSGGVNIYENGTWTNIITNEGLAENRVFYDVFEDTTGIMWFGTIHGLSKFEDNNWESYFTNYQGGTVGKIQYDYNGVLCAGGQTNHFYRQYNNNWDTLMCYVGGGIFDFISYGNDDYWKSGAIGVTHFSPPFNFMSSWQTYNISDGLPSNLCYCIEQDSTDKIWVGTDNGIAYYMWPGFTVVTPPSDDFSKRINDIRIDLDENIWFASRVGVVKFDGTSTWEFLFEGQGLSDNCVWDIEIASDSTIWFATQNGITILSNSGMTHIHKSDGLISNVVYCLEEDHLGNMWAGTLHGVTLIHNAITIPSNIIIERADKLEVIVYPNPATNTIFIKSDHQLDYFEIYNFMGQQIESNLIQDREIEINILLLPNGNYFLKTYSQKGISVNKFVVLR